MKERIPDVVTAVVTAMAVVPIDVIYDGYMSL